MASCQKHSFNMAIEHHTNCPGKFIDPKIAQNASLCILMGKLWSVFLAFNYEAALTPSWKFSQELSKDPITTYLKQKLVPTVWHWFSGGGGGVKLHKHFIIWIFGVLQSSQISLDCMG